MGKSKTAPVMEFFGEKVQFKAAPEPSNIIWENLEITAPMMRKREAIAGFSITAFIVVVVLVITLLKAYSGKTKAKYPGSVDCEQITNDFTLKWPCDPNTEDCTDVKTYGESIYLSKDAIKNYGDYAG